MHFEKNAKLITRSFDICFFYFKKPPPRKIRYPDATETQKVGSARFFLFVSKASFIIIHYRNNIQYVVEKRHTQREVPGTNYCILVRYHIQSFFKVWIFFKVWTNSGGRWQKYEISTNIKDMNIKVNSKNS